MRNIKAYGVSNTNPFASSIETRRAVLFMPDEYTLHSILSLSPGAIRVLLIIVSKFNPEQDMATLTTRQIRDALGTTPARISSAKTELIRASLIAYAKPANSYYINPKAFRPITISL